MGQRTRGSGQHGQLALHAGRGLLMADDFYGGDEGSVLIAFKYERQLADR
jgi:hypothetical protein